MGLMQQVDFWVAAVKRDIDTPELWAELQRETELLGAVSDEAVENTPFTSAEQDEIAEQLRKLRDVVRPPSARRRARRGNGLSRGKRAGGVLQ